MTYGLGSYGSAALGGAEGSKSSIVRYGLRERTFESKVVWHDDSISAFAFAERLVARYKEPLDTVRFQTRRGTQAAIHQIGDVIALSWDQVDFASKHFTMYGLKGRLSTDEWEILAEDHGILTADFFILDSSSNGVLDENVLY